MSDKREYKLLRYADETVQRLVEHYYPCSLGEEQTDVTRVN